MRASLALHVSTAVLITAALSGCGGGPDADEPVTDGGTHACDAYGPYGGGPPWGFDASTSRIAHWDGTEWSVVQSGSPGRLDSVSGSGPADIWATGIEVNVGAPLLHWDGSSWSDAHGHGLDAASSVWAAATDDAWASGYTAADGQGLFHWDGSTWTFAWEGSAFLTVRGRSPDEVWALRAGGVLGIGAAHYQAGTWTKVDSSWEGQPYDLWPSARDDVWVVGAPGGFVGTPWTPLVHWDGSSWTTYKVRETWMIFSGVWGSAPDDVWAAGELWEMPVRSIILRWDGISWKEAPRPPHSTNCSAIWGTASDDVWVSCMGWCSEAFYVFHWDGAAWTETATFDWYPEAFWGSGRDDVWLVGWGGPT